MNADTYINLCDELVTPECFDWLEDSYYYNEDGKRLSCSRYCIGYDEEGDGLSIWLDDDFREVDA